MTWDQQPVDTDPVPPGSTSVAYATASAPNGFRRAILTAGMAAALLVTGGVAIVAAASPEPSASTTPSATGAPSTDGSSGTTRQGHSGQPCPNDGSSGGSSGSSGSGGQSSEPTPSTTTPAT